MSNIKGVLDNLLSSSHSLVTERIRMVPSETIRIMAGKKSGKSKMPIKLPDYPFYYPQFRRATPWGGSLNVRLSVASYMDFFKQRKSMPPFVVIDTDYSTFGGAIFDISAMRNLYSGPILVRDFYLSDYQIDEAKAAGADGVIFPASLRGVCNYDALEQICHQWDMSVYYQVSSIEDFDVLSGSEDMVFISPVRIGNKIKIMKEKELFKIFDEVGNDRAVLIDNLYDATINFKYKDEMIYTGASYPDVLWGGDHSLKLFDMFIDQDADYFYTAEKKQAIDSKGHNEEENIESQIDDVWVLFVQLQYGQSIFIPYENMGLARKGFHTLYNAWRNHKDKEESSKDIYVVDDALDSALYTVDLSIIQSMSCLPFDFLKETSKDKS